VIGMSQLTLQQAFQIAIQHHQAGRLPEAEQICRQILDRQPNQPDATYLLGLVALDGGRFTVASEILGRASKMMPDFPYVHFKLGISLARQGKNEEAIAAFRRAIELNGDFSEAISSLSIVLMRKGKLDEAIAGFRKLAQLEPKHAEVFNNLGIALAGKGQMDEAILAMSKAVQIKPGSAEANRNLGRALAMARRSEDAIAAFRQAVEIKPDYVEANSDLGVALTEMGRLDEATAAFERAIQSNPNFATARFHRALILLLKGDFARGWPEYEWRWQAEGFPSPRRNFAQPQWDGEALRGKTILLHAEQGYGDFIHFVRYVPLVAGKGARIVIECPPELDRLVRGIPEVAEVIRASDPLPPFDVHSPLMSLPKVFRTTLDSIPAAIPYLKADEMLVDSWARRLGKREGAFRVGLTWAGRPEFVSDRFRSLELSALSSLGAVDGITFYSFQKGPVARQALTPPTGMKVIPLGDELQDFADTAAVISQMDLILSTDTSVPHLAGALGKPVWVMLPFLPDWRWLLMREDSPWYPTMRLFRQKKLGDWAEVVDRVAKSLQSIVVKK
jgi:Flp pilus assembly protein TadD